MSTLPRPISSDNSGGADDRVALEGAFPSATRSWIYIAGLFALAATLSASSLVIPMTGSKWALYASGGAIECGVSACGSGQSPGTLPNGAGIYFDFPNALDLPVGPYLNSIAFARSGPNDATWESWPSGVTAAVTFCALINGVNVYRDAAGPHDSISWGTDAACTNGGTTYLQSTSGIWLKDGVLTLGKGVATIRIPLQPQYWVQTWGKTGSSTTALTSAFNQSIASVGAIGAAIGGGCSFGHGANVSGEGTARLILRSYAVY